MAEVTDVRDIDEAEQPARKGMKLPILIGLIVGIIVVQVGIVMAAIRFFGPSSGEKGKSATEKVHEKSKDKDGEEGGDEEESNGYIQKVGAIVSTKTDLYINPKGSSSHIVVMSLGIEISPEEKAEEVDKKLMIPIQDRVISRVSGYTVEDLENVKVRDSLRTIIKNDIKPFFRGLSEDPKEGVKLRNVYFPKFIIQ